MLMLSRKIGEEIVIDGDIRITVTKIQKRGHASTVQLGITAPGDINIRRGELPEEEEWETNQD